MKKTLREKFILLVEDDPDDAALILRALKKNNIVNDIQVMNSGRKALDFLFSLGEYENREPAKMPAVIFLDLKLPMMDGLEVLKRIRADNRTRLLPVVIFTSSKEERDLINCYALRCNSYVRKPVNFNEFAHKVQQLGLYWLLINESPPQS